MAMLLLILALITFTLCVFTLIPRRFPNFAWPFFCFLMSSPTIELAGFYLICQIIFTAVLGGLGFIHGPIGYTAVALLIPSWLLLAHHWLLSFKSPQTLHSALIAGLGHDFEDKIQPDRKATIRSKVSIADTLRPMHFDKSGINYTKNIAYADSQGIRQMLDIYAPENPDEGGCPVLLQIHGGAWIAGDKTHQGLPLMHYLAKRGWVCVAMNYRLSPSVGYPTHIQDVKAAIAWIRENGQDYGMNPDFIATTGGSAGAHLASLAALTPNHNELQTTDANTRIQACVSLFGVYDMLTRFDQNPAKKAFTPFLELQVMHSPRDGDQQPWHNYSPMSQLSDDAPPFFIMHGTRDSVIPISEARAFNKAFQEHSNAPLVYAELEGADHAFEMLHSPRTEYAINAIHLFLEWCLAQHNAKQS